MDCTETNKKAMSWLQGNLDEKRLLHSLGCAQQAAEFANEFGLDTKKAYIAGLLHDCAKCIEKEKMHEIASNLDLTESEINNEKIVHAPVSAYIAHNEFGIDDKEILSAIRWHTLGKTDMTTFEKIIFLSDKIEPHTRDMDFRDKIMMLFKDTEDKENALNRSLLICYKETIKSLVTRSLKICNTTVDIYNSMLK